MGLSHGKLINFGSERVEHRFVNCHETPDQRRQFQVEHIDWCSNGTLERLEQMVVPLVSDWGTGLTRSLYQEAIVALAGEQSGANNSRKLNGEDNELADSPSI